MTFESSEDVYTTQNIAKPSGSVCTWADNLVNVCTLNTNLIFMIVKNLVNDKNICPPPLPSYAIENLQKTWQKQTFWKVCSQIK